MLKEHKVGLAEEVDLQAITKQLEKEEQERHQQRVKQIGNSAAEAQLFFNCLNDPEAGEAGLVVRAYIKAWAATYGVDLEEVRRRKEEAEQLHRALIEDTEDEKKRGRG